MSAHRIPIFLGTPGLFRFVAAVDDERLAQLAKWGEQKHADGTGPDNANARELADGYRALNDYDPAEKTWQTILLEEVYEALAESDPARLHAELVQVAAVVAAWVRDIDTRPHPMICAHCGEAIPTDTGLNTWHGPIPTPGQPECTVPRYHLDPEYPECRKAGG